MTREEAIKVIENRDSIMDYCESAQLGEALDMAIEALSAETCEDAISRQAFIEWMQDKTFGDIVVASEHNFDCLPPVTPKQKMGRWIDKDASGTNFYGKCSCCGQEFQVDAWYTQNMNFCPNCGAEMAESED